MLEMLGLKKKKAVLKGEALIRDVCGRFSEMIDQLERGVQDCRVERDNIEAEIAFLLARNDILFESITEGNRLSGKLADLLG